GNFYDYYTDQAFFKHWDGSTWSTVPGAEVGAYESLNGIVAVSPRELWAVGEASDLSTNQTLVERGTYPCLYSTGTPTLTPTRIPTRTGTPAATSTSVPAPQLVGHVTWQGHQYGAGQSLPLTLSLRLSDGSGSATEYS